MVELLVEEEHLLQLIQYRSNYGQVASRLPRHQFLEHPPPPSTPRLRPIYLPVSVRKYNLLQSLLNFPIGV